MERIINRVNRPGRKSCRDKINFRSISPIIVNRRLSEDPIRGDIPTSEWLSFLSLRTLLTLIAYCFSVTGGNGNDGRTVALSAAQLKLNNYNELGRPGGTFSRDVRGIMPCGKRTDGAGHDGKERAKQLSPQRDRRSL